MLRRLASVAAVLAATALLPTAPATARAADPDYHRPVVGECRDMGWVELSGYADSEPTIDCSERHTARTVAVVSVPENMAYGDNDRVVSTAVTKCAPVVDDVLGRSSLVRVRTAYNYAFFMPTKSEWRHGARWLRCDLILLAGQHLAPLRTDAEPALPKGDLPDNVARCLVGRRADTTTCSRAHQWRAVGAFTLRQQRYPDDDASYRRVSRRCAALTSTRAFRWTSSGESSWKHGRHQIVCYDKNRR